MLSVKDYAKRVPVINTIGRRIYRGLKRVLGISKPFPGSSTFWEKRYATGGNSGGGSYGRLAEFKAEVLNSFVANEAIESVIEFGSGDGNQLRFAEYPQYIGFDISRDAVSRCQATFGADASKKFLLLDQYSGEKAELALSLDVIYHLVEDSIFDQYMRRLFDSATRYVAIYASNTDSNADGQGPHVRHRNFTRWIDANARDWKLLTHIPNRFPYEGDDKSGSFADFYIFSRV